MKAYKRKPLTVSAVQITDATFDDPCPNAEHLRGVVYNPTERVAIIQTRNGETRAEIGDWIVRSVKGDLYPCSDDVFRASYEAPQ